MTPEPSIVVAAPEQKHTSLTSEMVKDLDINAEHEISKVLAVPDLDNQTEIKGKNQQISDLDSNCGSIQDVKPKKQSKFVMKNNFDFCSREGFFFKSLTFGRHPPPLGQWGEPKNLPPPQGKILKYLTPNPSIP